MGRLDWKWIAIGVAIMVGLSLVASLILSFVLAPQIRDVTTIEEISLSSGQVILAAVLNFLTFAVGGFIVGIKSAGRTIVEPGISAALAVLLALVLSGNFSIVNLLVGGLVPFAAGVLGGWVGETRQGAA
jgi:hypothetical protein